MSSGNIPAVKPPNEFDLANIHVCLADSTNSKQLLSSYIYLGKVERLTYHFVEQAGGDLEVTAILKAGMQSSDRLYAALKEAILSFSPLSALSGSRDISGVEFGIFIEPPSSYTDGGVKSVYFRRCRFSDIVSVEKLGATGEKVRQNILHFMAGSVVKDAVHKLAPPLVVDKPETDAVITPRPVFTLRENQRKAMPALDWLFAPGLRRDGRSMAMAFAAIRAALRNPGALIVQPSGTEDMLYVSDLLNYSGLTKYVRVNLDGCLKLVPEDNFEYETMFSAAKQFFLEI